MPRLEGCAHEAEGQHHGQSASQRGQRSLRQRTHGTPALITVRLTEMLSSEEILLEN